MALERAVQRNDVSKGETIGLARASVPRNRSLVTHDVDAERRDRQDEFVRRCMLRDYQEALERLEKMTGIEFPRADFECVLPVVANRLCPLGIGREDADRTARCHRAQQNCRTYDATRYAH
jgi:hypothetical protein